MPSSSWVTIDLTKEEDRNNVLDCRGNTPNYGMELDSDEELLKGEELQWLRTLASIPKGAKHQGKVRNLAHDEIKAELHELCKDYMACDTSHRINDPALKELEEAMWASYHLLWEDFGHMRKQANAGVKFPKWSQWYLTVADPPMIVTGHLPRALSKSIPIKADWYDICNMDSPEFVKLHKQVLATACKERTTSMHVVIKWMTTQAHSTNVSLINVLPTTGQSLGTVGLDLHDPVFAHGWFYVGVSRGTNWSRVKVLLKEGRQATIIVYKDILLRPA
jgi:hypothetical protein